MILVDTSVWSLAFRRPKHNMGIPYEVNTLHKLIENDDLLALPGIVLQELLSGLREEAQFNRLRRLLKPFPVILATQDDHITAARIANLCRSSGVATSPTDCLIAAIAITRNAELFTADRDFVYMAEHCSLRLFSEVHAD
ncbi:type II toxin-antitoxin system VapC family toxin [Desulfonema magnum]|uniref:Ribonuclease VapC n=1 Tax=Desulfonema magnum TaxID=45655 RepID=A0A975BKF4_9BACT|nr:PIN domain-containing protein [Desulfonema magnum]QTA86763.1 PIN domain-containing protein [Desulfonema magnum]